MKDITQLEMPDESGLKFPEGSKIICKFVAGSHLYGTSTEISDVDLRGIFIPPKEYFMGFLKRIKTVENKTDDIQYTELRQFMYLAADNNPNIIEFLFVPEKMWIVGTKEWEKIIENRDLFLSKKAKHTFIGYCISQWLRTVRHRGWLQKMIRGEIIKKPKREDFGLPSDKSILTKDAIGAFNHVVAAHLNRIHKYHDLKDQIEELIEFHNFKEIVHQTEPKDVLEFGKVVEVSENFLIVVQKEKAYRSKMREYTAFQTWLKNRNPVRFELEKKYKMDTKFVSHINRLLSEGAELLLTGNITFPRPDAEHLLDIRNGKYSFEEMEEMIGNVEEKFIDLYNKSTLPKEPKRTKIDELCVDIIEEFLK